jgi:hypothetical protein
MTDSSEFRDLDGLLRHWPFEPGPPQVRQTTAGDGRALLLMRVELGVLQLETTGRPDGLRPHGFDTIYDYLMAAAFAEGPDFTFDEARRQEIDREFYQYYHRRICWLALQKYSEAAADAEHTLRLMDFTGANAQDPQWAAMHEQYRPFVLFQLTQARSLKHLEAHDPAAASRAIDEGLAMLARMFELHNAQDQYAENLFVVKLQEMQSAIKTQFDVAPDLAQQLAEAVAAEQYERAAQLRDEMARRRGN